jgi:hypothetical protein
MIALRDQKLVAIALFNLYDSLMPLLIANDETDSFRFDLTNSFRFSKANFYAIGGVDAADRLNTPMQSVLLRAIDQEGLHRICLSATGPLNGGVVLVGGSSRQ